MRLITGVWRTATGAQWVKIAFKWADFKAADLAYFQQGLRLVRIEVEGGTYTGVWRPGSGAQWVHAGLSWADFKTKDLAYFNEGLRLVDIEIDDGTYTGVWRPGTGAQWVQTGLSWTDFKTQDLAYFNQGLRLVDIELDGGTYTGVWRPGSGTQWVHTAISTGELVSLDQGYAKEGLRIAILKVQEGKLTAVWQPGTGAQVVEMGLSLDRFVAEDTQHFKDGLRLRALEVHEQPLVVYRLPFGDATGWSLAKGNWDDPGNGHNKGDPNGWQSYAYDFVHAEGGSIKAARGGIVHDFDESSSKNGFNSATPCDPGVGNYLVVKHDDGTFGVYWHLQHKGVLVALGQKVSVGDVIGISGNTGNSSAPHLHFDVRLGWDLSYSCSNLSESPGYPVFFRDKNHTAWRPKAGEALATDNV